MTGLIYGEEGADMDRISVRKAGEKDVEALAHILVTSFKTAFADIIREETIDRCSNEENCRNMFAAICASGEGQFYIAELDGKPCGELYRRDGDELECSAHIVAIHSLPETWGCGIGKAMVEAALRDVREERKKRVYLWAFKENHRARRFYEKNGFVWDGSERVSEFDGAMEIRYTFEFV